MTHRFVVAAAMLVGFVGTTAPLRVFPQSPARTESSDAPRFDAVSIRPSDPKSSGYAMRPGPDGITMTGVSVKVLILFAYDVNDFQIANAPGWIDSARFDLVAKVDMSSAQLKLPEDWPSRRRMLAERLQTALVERFNLRLHRETSVGPVYALVVAKGGPRLKASTSNTGYTQGPEEIRCSDTSMETLASMLSVSTEREVIDRTGLMGEYAFDLKWAPANAREGDSPLPDLVTAIQEQLGLKLLPTKGPMEVLHIDHVEAPSAN